MISSAGALALLPALSKLTMADGMQLTVATYGGPYQAAQTASFFDRFVKANPGSSIAQDPSVGDAKVKSMVEIGDVTWDIVVLSPYLGFDTDGAWFEPIDYAVVTKDKFLPGLAHKYRVGADFEGSVLVYNKEQFKTPVKGLAALFDTQKYPGKRALRKFVASGIIEAALIADGVNPKQLYPLDLPRAFKKLDAIKDQIVWWDGGAEAVQLMTSGETPLGLLWLSAAVTSMKSAPVDTEWTNWIPDNAWWAVPKGSKNAEAAMKAIEFFTQPENQATFSSYLPYAPTTTEGTKIASANFKGNLPSEHFDTMVPIDFNWWNQKMEENDREFQSWLLS
jgi:putative spermidine/putrescine transport system substrate-binding protein